MRENKELESKYIKPNFTRHPRSSISDQNYNKLKEVVLFDREASEANPPNHCCVREE